MVATNTLRLRAASIGFSVATHLSTNENAHSTTVILVASNAYKNMSASEDSLLGKVVISADASPQHGLSNATTCTFNYQDHQLLERRRNAGDSLGGCGAVDEGADLALHASFDPSLFDFNWNDEATTCSTGATSSYPCGLPIGSSEDGLVEACPGIFTCGLDESGSKAPGMFFARTYGVSNSPSVQGLSGATLHPHAIHSSAECPSTVNGVVQLKQPALGLRDSAAPPAPEATNMSWVNNPALQTLALNAMASAGPNLASYFLPQSQPIPQHQQLMSSQQSAAAGADASGTTCLPPFFLLDAPLELRANFMASLQSHGIPSALEDNNAAHYQQQLLSGGASNIRLVDGRHGGIGNKRVKNEREQKRTQKITDLIDQLRDKMVEGGWKVGGSKSKYATLSTYVSLRFLCSLAIYGALNLRFTFLLFNRCAEYVKYLVQANKEKEQAVEKTRQDLEVKQRHVALNALQDPSDLESSGSGLTTSSNSHNVHPLEARLIGGSDELRTSSGSERASYSQENRGCRSGSSYGGHSSGGSASRSANRRIRGASHDDKVVRERKRKVAVTELAESSLMETAFDLDYEEVFLKSNVPQLLASTSGQIIAWNDFFLKATGMSASEVDRLTIFSLVRQADLSKLFEIVAAALRSRKSDGSEESEDEPNASPLTKDLPSSKADATVTGKWNYTAITLPCSAFPARCAATVDAGDERTEKPLYVTVTLMTDDDPQKRCFHCVFTDCPGTNGALGLVTPELLSLLFAEQNKEPASMSNTLGETTTLASWNRHGRRS